MRYEDQDEQPTRRKPVTRNVRFHHGRFCGGVALCCAFVLGSALTWAQEPSRSEGKQPSEAGQKPGRGAPPAGSTPRALLAPGKDGAPAHGRDKAAPDAPRGAPGSGAPGRSAPGSASAPDGLKPSERGLARGVDARTRALENYRAALKEVEEGEDGGDEAKRRRNLERAKKQLQRAHQKLKNKAPELTAEQRKARDEKLAAWLEKARADRDKRREERLARWKQAHGDRIESPAFRNELLRHSWRVARLERLAQIAEAEGREELKTKAQELLEKEGALHERRLAQLGAGKPSKKEPNTLPATAKSPAAQAVQKPAAQKGAE